MHQTPKDRVGVDGECIGYNVQDSDTTKPGSSPNPGVVIFSYMAQCYVLVLPKHISGLH